MENQIQEEVERLREQFGNTRDLYREVCALLFFRYGITPTTNKLYQFVRKGSMSVPTEVLSHFWKDLREKSNIRIEQPDLPEDLGKLAGELMAKIWDKAQFAAHESLTALRSEAEANVTQLQTERDAIACDRDDVVLKLRNAEEMLVKKSDELTALNQVLADSETYRTSLEKQLHDSATQLEVMRQKMDAETERFNASIAEIRSQQQNELSQATRELNREQAQAADLEKALAATQAASEKLQDQHRIEISSLKAQLADLREKLGELNGKLELTQFSNAQLNAEIASKETKLKEILIKLANTDAQPKNWSDRIHQKKLKRVTPSR